MMGYPTEPHGLIWQAAIASNGAGSQSSQAWGALGGIDGTFALAALAVLALVAGLIGWGLSKLHTRFGWKASASAVVAIIVLPILGAAVAM